MLSVCVAFTLPIASAQIGRCGPLFNGRVCDPVNGLSWEFFCREIDGWCQSHWTDNYLSFSAYDYTYSSMSQNHGRCGPHFAGRVCDSGYCNEEDGWCSATAVHRDAQHNNTAFDAGVVGRCGPLFQGRRCNPVTGRSFEIYCVRQSAARMQTSRSVSSYARLPPRIGAGRGKRLVRPHGCAQRRASECHIRRAGCRPDCSLDARS